MRRHAPAVHRAAGEGRPTHIAALTRGGAPHVLLATAAGQVAVFGIPRAAGTPP